jgi:hypothetical protein
MPKTRSRLSEQEREQRRDRDRDRFKRNAEELPGSRMAGLGARAGARRAVALLGLRPVSDPACQTRDERRSRVQGLDGARLLRARRLTRDPDLR